MEPYTWHWGQGRVVIQKVALRGVASHDLHSADVTRCSGPLQVFVPSNRMQVEVNIDARVDRFSPKPGEIERVDTVGTLAPLQVPTELRRLRHAILGVGRGTDK